MGCVSVFFVRQGVCYVIFVCNCYWFLFSLGVEMLENINSGNVKFMYGSNWCGCKLPLWIMHTIISVLWHKCQEVVSYCTGLATSTHDISSISYVNN